MDCNLKLQKLSNIGEWTRLFLCRGQASQGSNTRESGFNSLEGNPGGGGLFPGGGAPNPSGAGTSPFGFF